MDVPSNEVANARAAAVRHAAAALLVPVASEMVGRAIHVPLCLKHTPAAIARAAVLLAASRVGLVASAASATVSEATTLRGFRTALKVRGKGGGG